MNKRGRAVKATFGPIVEGLANPRRLMDYDLAIARIILAVRLQAFYERQCEDPLPDLAVRLQSVTLAGLVLEFTSCAKRVWPEPIQSARICCQSLSHDEASLATILASAREGNRGRFERELEGLVRADRRNAVWDIAVRIAAWM